MEKMYIVTGAYSLYFIFSDMSIEEIKGCIKDGENVKECDPAYAFGVRYGYQPIYTTYKGTDKLSGLPFVALAVVDKRELKQTLGITTGKNFW